MTVQEIKLKCLELADPKVPNSDVNLWIDRARKLEDYVMQGQGLEPPKKRRGRPPKTQADNPADDAGPANGLYSS